MTQPNMDDLPETLDEAEPEQTDDALTELDQETLDPRINDQRDALGEDPSGTDTERADG